MEVLFFSTIKFNKLMPKILWDDDFMSGSDKRKYSWSNKLLSSSFKEYGIKVRLQPDTKGKLELNYTFYMKRKFVPLLKEYYSKCKSNKLESALADIGVQITPATVTINIVRKTVEVKVNMPLLPYTDIILMNNSVAKYRDILFKKLSLLNRLMVSEASIDSDLHEKLIKFKRDLEPKSKLEFDDDIWSGLATVGMSSTVSKLTNKKPIKRVNINAQKLKGTKKP